MALSTVKFHLQLGAVLGCFVFASKPLFWVGEVVFLFCNFIIICGLIEGYWKEVWMWDLLTAYMKIIVSASVIFVPLESNNLIEME